MYFSRVNQNGASAEGGSILNLEAALQDHRAGQEEEDEEDEAFPASFGQPAKSFNSEETNKAFTAFFGDGNSEDEDEPLPVNAEPPNAPVAQLDQLNGDEDDEETEEDEPLPNGNNTAHEIPELSVNASYASASDVGFAPAPPPFSPPPAPPMSPPPPPPLESPPPAQSSSVDGGPASPSTFSRPASPAPPPPPSEVKKVEKSLTEEPEVAAKKEEAKKSSAPIDYTRYHQYRVLAQHINACLEMLSEVRRASLHAVRRWHSPVESDNLSLIVCDVCRRSSSSSATSLLAWPRMSAGS